MNRQKIKNIRRVIVVASIVGLLLFTLSGCGMIYDALDKIPASSFPNDRVLGSVFTNNNLETMREFIDTGVDVNCKIRETLTSNKVSPLYLVRSEEWSLCTPRIAEYLLEEGADPNFADSKGRTLLMHASGALNNKVMTSNREQSDFIKILIEYGADINQKSDKGLTALDYAVGNHYETSIKYLLENDAKISEQTLRLSQEDQFSQEPEYWLTKLIFEAAKKQGVSYKDDPLLEAAVYGDSDTVVKLLGEKDDDVYSEDLPFYIASYCNADALKCVEAEGFDLHSTDYWEEGLMLIAARAGNLEIVRYLVSKGFLVNASEEELAVSEASPLTAAVENNHYDVSAYLLSEGAIFDATEGVIFDASEYPLYGRNEMKGAVINGNFEMMTLIEEYGYHFNAEKSFFAAIEAIEVNQLEMLRYLLEHYVDSNYMSPIDDSRAFLTHACRYDNLDALKILKEYGAKIATDDSDALAMATEKGNYEIAEYLIENGMDVDASTFSNGLNRAIRYGFFDIVKLLVENGANLNGEYDHLMLAVRYSYRISQYLIDQGADINAQDENGNSPLMWAVMSQYPKCVEVLLNAGADTTLKNNEGLTAKEIAKKTLNSDIIKLFK